MATDQTIRVSARGEFGQLQQGLKQLQGDLKNVIGEIDKGARKGGIFDDSNLRALDLFKRRFQDSFGALEGEFNRQSDAMDKLWRKMKGSSGDTQKDLQKEIDKRAKIIDQINAQMRAMQDLYNRRSSESGGFGRSGGGSNGGRAGGEEGSGRRSGFGRGLVGGMASVVGTGASLLSGLLGGAMRVGMFGAGLAGIGGLSALATKAYENSMYRSTGTLDLAQRIRGGVGFRYNGAGANARIYDAVGNAGMRDNMGYTKQESWQFMDQMSRQAGYVTPGEETRLLKFGRGFGLSSSEVAGLTGQNWQLGGEASASRFTNDIAGAVSKSGMTPRVVEVMEANNALLQQLNTTFKDGSSRQILAYQTTLDKIGTDTGMQRLTGAQGANIIGGLGGIYQPGNDKWKWMGIRALQSYNPQKYGKMGLYDLESSFEDGLMNKDNMPAMVKYLKQYSGGNENNFKRYMQAWLQDGGFNATKSEVTDLMKATNDMGAFDSDKINGILNNIKNGNGGAKYDTQRKNETGQTYLDTEARFQQVLESVGNSFVDFVQGIKKDATEVGEIFTGKGGLQQKMGEFFSWLDKKMGGDGKSGGTSFTDQIEKAVEDGIRKGFNLPDSTDLTGGIIDKGLKAGDAWLQIHDPASPEAKKAMAEKQKQYAKSPWRTDWSGALSNSFDNLFGAIPKWLGGGDSPGLSDIFSGYYLGNANHAPGTGDVMDIGKMPKTVKDFSDKGKSDLQKLKDDGTGFFKLMNQSTSDNFTGMLTVTTQMFQKMVDTMQGFATTMSGVFTPITGLFNSIADKMGIPMTPVGMTGDFMTNAMKLITRNEGNYDTVTPDDNGALSIGEMQWHGNRARDLLKTIRDADPGKFYAHIPLNSSIAQGLGKDWSSRTLSRQEGVQIANLLRTDTSKGIQDQWAKQDVKEFIAKGQQLGITDQGALAYFADMYNQSPRSAMQIANESDKTLKGLYDVSMNNAVLSPYASRRKSAYSTARAMDSTSGAGGLGFLSGWRNKITSRFGDTEGRSTPHHGLDIAEAQGTSLGALAGGTVKLIRNDPGNKTSGGNTLEVQLPNGQKYLYAHMSQINANLHEGDKVTTGEWVGNSGGTPGVAGSGNDSTGAHLHIGYLDRNDNLMNPENLLNGLGVGDVTDIGRMAGAGKQSIDLNVNFNVSGEGATQLNKATENQLEYLVRKVLNQVNYEKLLMNPSLRGG